MNLLGVDLGIHKVAMFGWDGDIPFVDVTTVDPGFSRATQLHILAGAVHDMADFHDCRSVWIEDTLIGNNRKYSLQLTEVRGAVMSALAMEADIRLVNVATWKSKVVGDGHANKDSVRDYIHVTHGAYAPLCGSDQDLYDACCIALYGRGVMEQSKHLQLDSGPVAD